MKIKISSNVKELIKKLDKLPNKVKNNAVKKAIKETADIMKRDIQSRTPVHTGRLKGSFKVTIRVRNKKVTGIIGSNVPYAAYVNFGTGIYAMNGQGRKTAWIYRDESGKFHRTRGQKGHHMIEGALEKNKKRILSIFDKYIKREIK